MAPIDRYYDLAADVLETLVSGWNATGAEPLPNVQFVGMGALDFCEAITVFVERAFPIQADVRFEEPQVGDLAWNRAVTIGVSLARCVPQPEVRADKTVVLPSPEQYSESALMIYRDAQAIDNLIMEANRDLASCNGFAFESSVSIDPQATGMGGTNYRFRVSLVA